MKLKFNSEQDLISQLKELVYNLELLSDTKDSFDLSEAKWISPFSVLPVSYLLSKMLKPNIIYPSDYGINNYLATINFPNGTQSLSNANLKRNPIKFK